MQVLQVTIYASQETDFTAALNRVQEHLEASTHKSGSPQQLGAATWSADLNIRQAPVFEPVTAGAGSR